MNPPTEVAKSWKKRAKKCECQNMTIRPVERASLEKILDEHDMRISTLVDRVGSLDHKVDVVITAVAELKTAFAASNARSTLTFGNVLSYTRDLAVLVGLSVSAIVYITMASTSSKTANIEYRIEQMEKAHPIRVVPNMSP